jgi:hypothetical protein
MTDTITSTESEDPLEVLAASESAIAAMARKTLLRAGVHSASAQQTADAREAARIEYAAQAVHALRTGSVLP